MVKFSIIIVVKNGIKYIKETINSILIQTYKNYEIIIIDGGSTDGTIEFIKQIKFKDLYFETSNDSGPSYALNVASKFVTGDYVVHLHSDDLFINNLVLFKIANNIVSENYPFWITGFYKFINATGDEIRIDNLNSKITYKAMLIKNVIRHQATFFKAEYLKDNFFRHDCGTAFDYLFFLNMFYTFGNPFVVREYLIKFRLDGNNLSSNFVKSLKSERKARLIWRKLRNENSFFRFTIINLFDFVVFSLRYLKIFLIHNNLRKKF